MKINVYSPPSPIVFNHKESSIFLAGTIDNGNSFDWQSEFIKDIDKHIKKYKKPEYIYCEAISIYNPRRKDWNKNAEYTYTDATMYQQINWELNALEKANYIVFNFNEDSQSVITLLELGLYANKGDNKIIAVCCPEKYHKAANVYAVCDRYKIPVIKYFSQFFYE